MFFYKRFRQKGITVVEVVLYIIVFVYGIMFGSFMNVCIYRIPKEESVVYIQSHCVNCNKKIPWYDLIPLLSYFILRGKCRSCKSKISIQYPLIELLNGLLYVLTFIVMGWSITTVLSCFVISALIVLSIIDFRTYTINIWINIFILVMGIIKLITEIIETSDLSLIIYYLLGLVSVSGFLLIIYLVTSGRGIGMGDVNLMAAAGIFLGVKLIVLAFLLGCILGSIIHMILIRFFKHDRVLAFGPYLSFGIIISILYGESLIAWYINYLI